MIRDYRGEQHGHAAIAHSRLASRAGPNRDAAITRSRPTSRRGQIGLQLHHRRDHCGSVLGFQLRQIVDERDYLIRTIAFEAAGETEVGKAAVAYAVLNRQKRGRWGNTIKAVVTSPGQFEPWMTRRRAIENLSPEDPRYQRAAIIADAVLSGQTPDPTAGATHFLNPVIVRARRGGSLPSWASNDGRPIGRHVFYSPHEGDHSPKEAALSLGAMLDLSFLP